MLIKIADLKVNASQDYKGELIKAIQNAGFTVVVDYDSYYEKHYSISKESEE